MVDSAINAKRVIDAPMDQKGQALKRLGQGLGKLSLPGQMFYHDFVDAANLAEKTGNPSDAFMRLMMGRHVKEGNYSMRFLYTGDEDPGTLIFQNREAESALVDPYMRRHKLDQPADLNRFPLLEEIIGSANSRQESVSTRSSSFAPSGPLQGNMP